MWAAICIYKAYTHTSIEIYFIAACVYVYVCLLSGISIEKEDDKAEKADINSN